jgi:hypothetical protein
MTASRKFTKKNASGANMSEDAHSDQMTIVICQCCESQFSPQVEQVRQDVDLGYVCSDCFIQLRWAGARLKVATMNRCTKAHNSRGNNI